MDEEIRKLELETARLRLERERIALENDVERHRRGHAMETAAIDAAHTTKRVAGSLFSSLIDSLRIAWGAILFFGIGAAIALIASALWVAFAPRRVDGEYLYQFGYFLGDGGWMWIVGAGLASLVFILWTAAKG
jgi:hypothetical protein